MTILEKTAFHRTARWGACALVGVVALTACGEGTSDVATISNVPAAAPAAPYVAPEQQDRAGQLAARAERESAADVARWATVSTSGYASAEASARRAAKPYVSPEQADREALFEVRAAHASADSLDRAVPDTTSTPGSADALDRAVPDTTSTPASADALERNATNHQTSTPGSADALERWAISDGDD